jgi:hypothetical protein
MRITLAQGTGIVITSIIVLGRDLDILMAFPLGFLASLFVSLTEGLLARYQPS